MKNDKILLNVKNLDDLEKFKKLGITNFLFPLQDYSVGYRAFTLEEIAKTGVEAYVLANRVLTDTDIDSFLKMTIPSNVKGFIIEDTGLFYELINSNYELINFQNHLNNNCETVNYWLEYFSSLVVSTDIAREEIIEIVEKATKPLVLPVVYYPLIMYSRRHLVGNYFEHLEEKKRDTIKIDISNSKEQFRLVENDYGTAVFDTKLVDIRDFASTLNSEKIKYYLFDTIFLEDEEIVSALEGKEIEGSTVGFLETKTVYKVGDLK